MPTVPQVVVGKGNPFGTIYFSNNTKAMNDLARESVSALVNALTLPPEPPKTRKAESVPRITKITGDLETVQRVFLEKHWSDGLPFMPPTEQAVKWMLTGTKRSPNEVIGVFEPGYGVATVEKIAANGVMVGALPEYMPVLIAVVEALVDPAFELSGLATTAAPATPLLIINGPIIKELNFGQHYSFSLGYGSRPDVTIGRFARMMMINFSHIWPGINDMTSLGWPGERGLLFAENEATTPKGKGWDPFNVEQGFPPGSSTVSVYPAMAMLMQIGGLTTSPEVFLTSVAKVMGTAYSMTSDYTSRAKVVILSSDHVNMLADAGWSKNDAKRYLYEFARYSLADCELVDACIRHWDMLRQSKWTRPVQPNQMIPIVAEPEDIKILVGPDRTGEAYIPSWGHNSHIVTKEIKK
jgi:hypothetical protein